jgi:hypothetical protein
VTPTPRAAVFTLLTYQVASAQSADRLRELADHSPTTTAPDKPPRWSILPSAQGQISHGGLRGAVTLQVEGQQPFLSSLHQAAILTGIQ